MRPIRRNSVLRRVLLAGLALIAIGLYGSSRSDSFTGSARASSMPAQAISTSGTSGIRAGLKLRLPKLTAAILHVQGAAQSDQMIGFGIEDALKQLHIPYTSLDPQGDPGKTAADLDTLISRKPDVIFGISVEPAEIQAQLRTMKSKGIPFINTGGTIHESPLVALSPVPSDYAQAAIATQYLLDLLASENPSSPGTPTGEVAEFGFDPIYSLLQRRLTFETMVKQNPGVTIVANHQVNFANPNKDIQDATQAILQAHPKLKAIYTCCDFTLPPIIAGLRQVGANKVKVVSVQLGTPAALDLVKKGQVAALGNAALGASSWMAVDEFVTAKAEHRAICRDCWHQYEYMFAYSMVTKQNLQPSFLVRPKFPVQKLIVNYPAFFKAKWAKEFGTR